MKKAKIAQAPRGGHPPPPYGGLESLRGLQLAETSRFSLVDICQPCQLVTPSGSSTCLLVAATNPPPWGGLLAAFPQTPRRRETPNPRSSPPPTSLAQGASPSLRFLRFSRFLRTFFLESAFSRPESRSPNPQNPQKTQNPQVSVLSS